MQIRQSGVALLLTLFLGKAMAQTTYVPLWAKESWFLDRLEIKAQTDNDLNLSTVKPYMRKAYVAVADSFRQMLLEGKNPANLTPIDQHNLDRFQANNSEYSKFDLNSMPGWKSKKPWGKYWFPTPGNLLEVNTKDFYLSVNPALNFQYSYEKDYNGNTFVNSRGVTARGLIAKKIGFHFFLTDNQEVGPAHFRQIVNKDTLVPGAGNWKPFKDSGVDYFDARGSATWNVTKYINMQFGYDRQFIGNGYRSLMLSDFSNSALFLKFNTRIWKINYTNLFQEIFPSFGQRVGVLLDRKYTAMHHFGINATKWLNVGLFESVIFGRENHFDFSYLIPIIFLRSIEMQNGSPDNANIGLDFKANIAKKFQVYGQLMLDEFNLSELREDRTWWGNKYGLQLGAKYVDVLGVKNLDFQVEFNQVRPFTYSHYDSVANYTHYKQPLAHPLGANLREVLTIVRYQPAKKWYGYLRASFWKQGLDSAGINFGSNPLKPNQSRSRNYGYEMFSGIPATGMNLYGVISYEVKENLFIELSGMYRPYETEGIRTTTSTATVGLRWNMFRREYEY